MKKSVLIALSAVSAALATVFLVVGIFVPMFDYSCIFIASVCMMIPLTKKSVRGGILAFVASALLTLLFSSGRWEVVVTYALFFGLHPTANFIFREKKLNKIIAFLIKEVWFIASLLVVYFLFESFFAFETEWARAYALPIIIVGGGLLFVVYDFAMIRFQKLLDIAVKRLKL
ncbi:MAG: hypothetical protein IJ800_04915 [Clostridia bacterium]|nr:hypothetical protein [Clostridia bacterium]